MIVPLAPVLSAPAQHQLLYFGFSIHQEVASDPFCLLVKADALLIFGLLETAFIINYTINLFISFSWSKRERRLATVETRALCLGVSSKPKKSSQTWAYLLLTAILWTCLTIREFPRVQRIVCWYKSLLILESRARDQALHLCPGFLFVQESKRKGDVTSKKTFSWSLQRRSSNRKQRPVLGS